MIRVGDRVVHEHGTMPGTVVREFEWDGPGKRFEVVYNNGLRATVSAANLQLVEQPGVRCTHGDMTVCERCRS